MKKINGMIIAIAAGSMLIGCGAGSNSSTTTVNVFQVSATNCENMPTNTSNCLITITYASNTGNNLAFSNLNPPFTYVSPSNPSSCKATTANQQMCTLRINYGSGGGSQTLSISFGTAGTQPILISGQ